MYRRRPRRRISIENIIFIIVFLLVMLAVIFPAANVLLKPPKTETEIEFAPSISQTRINVYAHDDIVTMDLEEYLVCVVAAEMPASFELEALKAQAVAARTYTMYKKNNGGCSAHNGADICTDSTHCQAFISQDKMQSLWNTDADEYLNKIKQAVGDTQGQVLYFEGEEIQVFYHASSGGQTENCENVYSQALPYLKSVTSEGEQDYANYYGQITISMTDFAEKMAQFSPSIKINTDDIASSIGAISRFESGRVESIDIGNESFTGREIRKIFSLNSTNFNIEVKDDITFSTVGFGHGVGMSQTGANAMAKDGATYEQILKHYYTGVTIE